jgi:hypothetical protein
MFKQSQRMSDRALPCFLAKRTNSCLTLFPRRKNLVFSELSASLSPAKGPVSFTLFTKRIRPVDLNRFAMRRFESQFALHLLNET